MSHRLAAVLLAVSLTAMSGLAIRAAGAGGATVGAMVVVDPTVASISLAHTTLKAGQSGRLTASVTNRGTAPVTSVRLAIVGPPGLSIVPGPFAIVSLAGNATRSSSWTVCGSQPGNYVILARATALDQEGRSLAADSTSVVLMVVGRVKACR